MTAAVGTVYVVYEREDLPIQIVSDSPLSGGSEHLEEVEWERGSEEVKIRWLVDSLCRDRAISVRL